MRFWLSKSSEVPLREQLVIQVRLGIASGDLKARQKLPSTRELARRFKIHSNTVSAAYRELARQGWVEFRKGSGVYVRPRVPNRAPDGKLELDQLISFFLHAARDKGHSPAPVRSCPPPSTPTPISKTLGPVAWKNGAGRPLISR